MKTYRIKLLTANNGVIEVIYKDSQDLSQFETEILQKHGQFTTLSCNEIV